MIVRICLLPQAPEFALHEETDLWEGDMRALPVVGDVVEVGANLYSVVGRRFCLPEIEERVHGREVIVELSVAPIPWRRVQEDGPDGSKD